MTAARSQVRGVPSRGPFLNAVTSLNLQRRNDALYLLAREYGKPLTPHDIRETQVLAEVFQLIQAGKAVFGGRLYAMPFGPVVERTFNDCTWWASGLLRATMLATTLSPDEQPLQPSAWTGSHNLITEFCASTDYARGHEASWDWFSVDEQFSIKRAYEKVIGMSPQQSQAYFHEPISAIGYAYDRATAHFPKPFKKKHVEMNWFDVLDGAERIDAADCSHARAMLNLWV